MSSQVHLQAIKVTDLPHGSVRFGFCAWDDEAETWHACYESKDLTGDPMSILGDAVALFKLACATNSNVLLDMLAWARAERDGIYINDEFHEWDGPLGRVYSELADKKEPQYDDEPS